MIGLFLNIFPEVTPPPSKITYFVFSDSDYEDIETDDAPSVRV